MASRLSLNTLRASASRARPHETVPRTLSSRTMASSNPPPPAERPPRIVDQLSSHPSFTKTGTAILGSGLFPTAISQELYMFNKETVISTVRLPNKELAENHITRIKGVLDDARAERTQAVKDRVDEVGQMKDGVSLAKRTSKETAQLEAALVRRRVEDRTLHLDPCLRGGGYPQYILTSAAKLNNDNESDEDLFFPLYNKILFYWFPPTEGYDVCPKWFIPDYTKMEGFTINFVVEHERHPLLLIEVKPPLDFQFHSGRSVAINQVLNRLDEIGPNNLHADRLYAISAIGKRWRACYTLKGKNSESGGRPVKGVAVRNPLRFAHPECWNPDITSNTSWVALQNIVDTIKGYVAQ